MPIELTEQLLKLPRVLAAKLARPGTAEYDELLSAANLELARAAGKCDPSRSSKPISYLWKCVELKLRGEVRARRAARRCRLFSEVAAEGRDFDAPGRPDRDRAWVREAVEALEDVLDPLAYAVLWALHAEGLTLGQVGRRIGRSASLVRRISAAALKRARASHKFRRQRITAEDF